MIQKAKQTPNRRDPKSSMPGYIIIKLMTTRKNTLKTCDGKDALQRSDRVTGSSHMKPWCTEDRMQKNRHVFFCPKRTVDPTSYVPQKYLSRMKGERHL